MSHMSQMAPSNTGEGIERRSTAANVADRSGAGDTTLVVWLPRVALGGALVIECLLLLIALVPATEWTNLGQSPDGPIPHSLNWLVAGAFYVLPAAIGALCRRWQVAVALGALPAFLDLGVYAVATASRLGPFNLAQDSHAPYTVGTLELFAMLGALGWLGRSALLLALADRAQRQGTDQ